jgi:hypothetical protein
MSAGICQSQLGAYCCSKEVFYWHGSSQKISKKSQSFLRTSGPVGTILYLPDGTIRGLRYPPYLPQPTNSTHRAIYQGEEKNEALFLYYSELKNEGIREIRGSNSRSNKP